MLRLWPYALALLSGLLWWLAPERPDLVESLYSQTSFTWLVWLPAFFSSLFPFALSEWLAPLMLLVLLWCIVRLPWRTRFFKSLLLSCHYLLLTLALLWSSFVLLWGLNYWRQPLVEHYQLTSWLSEDDKRQAWQQASVLTNDLRAQLGEQSCFAPDFDQQLVTDIRAAQQQSLARLGLPSPARSVREPFASPWLRDLRIAGFYSPWVAQAHVSRYVAPGLKPMVIAHELAHANGIGPEHEADMLAFISLWQAQDPALQYAGWLAFWWQATDHDLLSSKVRKDLGCIRAYRQQFEVQVERAAPVAQQVWQVYDQYLQQSGVEQGLKSYAQGVEWALAYFWHQMASTPQ